MSRMNVTVAKSAIMQRSDNIKDSTGVIDTLPSVIMNSYSRGKQSHSNRSTWIINTNGQQTDQLY